MTIFWLYAGLLFAVALAFILAPQLRRPHRRIDDNRTRLNVGLYHECLRELETQHDDGKLDAVQVEAGRVEAALNLLDDAQVSEHAVGAPLGRAIPLVLALSMPLVALVMYLHWGSLDQLILARQHSGKSIQSIEKITSSLEALLTTTSESAEGWSLLGRAYMKEKRMADAARAFERAAILAGRPSELLGRWAQALYFASDRQWTPQLQALTDEALASDAQEAISLDLLGIAKFQAGRYVEAIAHWERLIVTLQEGDPTRDAIAEKISHSRELAETSATDGP